MKCKVEGCGRDAMYKKQRVCQMHYFRNMRNNTYDTIMKRKYRIVNPAGYHKIYEPQHILSDSQGYIYEHRAILFSTLGHLETIACQLCGKLMSWDNLQTDHIDEDVTNNHSYNLRPLCIACNTERGRAKIPKHTANGRYSITYLGVTKTPTEWARDENVKVSHSTIIRRKQLGMSDEDALFSEKKTHNGKKPVKGQRPPSYTRKNAVVLSFNGEKKTAAEWSRDPRVEVSCGAIRARKKSGMSDYDSLFKKKHANRNIFGKDKQLCKEV